MINSMAADGLEDAACQGSSEERGEYSWELL